MRSPIVAVLSSLLLGSSFFFVAAAPHEALSSASHNSSPRPWRRLSDAITRRIWGLPEKQKSLGPSNGRTEADGKWLAQYGEDMVLRFNISNAQEAAALAEAADTLFLDVWEFNEDWVDIRLAKNVVPSLLGLLPSSLHRSHVPLLQDLDLAQAIVDSYPSSSATQSHDGGHPFSAHPGPSAHSGKGNPFFQDYQPLSVISPWMNLMASMFTTHVRQINVGISYEGRDIPALRVGVHPTNDDQPSSPRQAILITGGAHAREWISTSTVNYLAWSLISAYGKKHSVTKMLESFDFIFVPTLNPDGYVYSWEMDRLWRKNRQPTSLRFCRGIDLDRSYSFKWEGESARSNPCSESFAGDAPFEGVEAQRFAEWAKNETENNNVEFVGFLDLHSYSQQILYPYSYSCDDEPPSLEDLEELALGLAKAIRISRKGHVYKTTSACEGNVAMGKNAKDKKGRAILPRMELVGGSALDWFHHELRVKYAYQVKLRDTGSYGFLLPKENIIPTGEEVLEAILYFSRFLQGEIGFGVEDTPSTHPMETVNEARKNEIDETHTEVYEEEHDEFQFELRRKR